MRFRRPADEEPEVNLIPLIDILLVVLIFLAISTTYSRYAELKIELPTADATQPAVRPNEINVAVTADGRYALERKIVGAPEVHEFAEVLRRAAQGKEPARPHARHQRRRIGPPPVGHQRDGSRSTGRHREDQLRHPEDHRRAPLSEGRWRRCAPGCN